jgi:excisionase family DNA binding protein
MRPHGQQLGAAEGGETATTLPKLWRPAALARQLGLSRQTIYALIRRGHLEAVRVGGAVGGGALRVYESSVIEYLRRCSERGR